MPAVSRSKHKVTLELRDPATGVWVGLGEWAGMEGGGVSGDASSYHDWDGLTRLDGVREREDITLRRLYGKVAGEVYKTLDGWVGRAEAKVSRVATDPSGAVIPGAEVLTYPGRLKGASLSDVDKSSGEGTEIMLVIAAEAELA